MSLTETTMRERHARTSLSILVGILMVVTEASGTDRRVVRSEPLIPQAPALLAIPVGLDLYMPIPDDNPLLTDRVLLGRRLFSDSILSRDGTVTCATCHDPRRVFTDGRSLGVGVFGRLGARHVPTLINRGYGRTFFWDGRASRLEDQVLQPIENPTEFGLTIDEAIKRLNSDSDYVNRFWTAFARRPNAQDLARALAGYVRTILSGDSPVDRYFGGDSKALPPEALEGLRLFRGKAHCTACHFGSTFTDERFHNTGVAWRNGVWLDAGRVAVTGNEADRGAFKTPTLRDVARTAPYMHDGSIMTLDAVVEFYDRGGNGNPNLDTELRPLGLTSQEKQELLAFLGAISGSVVEGPSR
jgi:cytochrome c peroxidase